jgi:hypothetical protein
MNYVLAVLVTILALAVMKVVLFALGAALLLVLLLSLLVRPRETLGLLASMGVLGLAGAHPVPFIITLGVVGVALVVVGAARNRRSVLLITEKPEER